MENAQSRRGFLGRLAALAGGLLAIPAMGGTALAGRSRRRFGWGGGYGGYYRRGSSHRRYYGGYGFGRPYYGGYYRPVAPPAFYGPGYYAPAPSYYYPPLMKRQATPFPDPLGLLEA